MKCKKAYEFFQQENEGVLQVSNQFIRSTDPALIEADERFVEFKNSKQLELPMTLSKASKDNKLIDSTMSSK
jgi:hypothetical protein